MQEGAIARTPSSRNTQLLQGAGEHWSIGSWAVLLLLVSSQSERACGVCTAMCKPSCSKCVHLCMEHL